MLVFLRFATLRKLLHFGKYTNAQFFCTGRVALDALIPSISIRHIEILLCFNALS